MSSITTAASAIRGIDHREAMALAEEEATRLLDVVDQLADDDWIRPTDCDGWDVKALLSHVLGPWRPTRACASSCVSSRSLPRRPSAAADP